MASIVKNKTRGGASAGNGNAALQRCVSLANGALRSDQRVNYEFGLVLGVDDFRQEQLYFLEKDYLHSRGLHGYGTVFGLEVTASRPADNSDEMLITVQPGMALDQLGRPIVVRDEQCARLGAWYAKQVQDGQAPPPDEAGRLRCYVVAGYDECLDALVPIPGQPCSSSEVTQAPSRIRDAFTLELRWDAPRMAAWSAVRSLADLLNGIRFVPGLPEAQSDEAEIIAQVRSLARPPAIGPCAQAADMPAGSPPGALQLPWETARQALDRIFAVWVTEVRPAIHGQPDLIEPGSDAEVEAGILLACIDFAPAAGFNPASPKIDAAEVSDGGRPFLLHTQLIQELLLLGGGQAAAKALREFATLQVRDSHTVWAWLHHPAAVEVTGDPLAAFRLTANGREIKLARVEPLAGFDNVAVLTTAPAAVHALAAGERLALTVDLAALREVGGSPLPDVLAASPYDYLGRTGDQVTVYAAVERILPSRDLATVRAVRLSTGQTALNLWFHTDAPVRLPKEVPVTLGQGGQRVLFAAQPVGGQGGFAFHWQLTPPADVAVGQAAALLLAFDAQAVRVRTAATTLAELIEREHLSFLGYDGRQTVWLYYQVELPPVVEAPPVVIPWDEVFTRIAAQLPTQPFVTITTVMLNSDQTVFELWFHLDRRFDAAEAVVFMEQQMPPPFRVFGERANGRTAPGDPKRPPRLVEIPRERILMTAVQSNVYRATVRSDVWKEFGSNYLRFAFPLDRTTVMAGGAEMSLGDYIKQTGIKFEGHNGEDAVVAFHRVLATGGIG